MIGRGPVLVGDGLRARSVTGDDRHQPGRLAGVGERGEHGSRDLSQADHRISDLLRHALLSSLETSLGLGVSGSECKAEATESRYKTPNAGGFSPGSSLTGSW